MEPAPLLLLSLLWGCSGECCGGQVPSQSLNPPCCLALPAALFSLPHGTMGQHGPRVSPLLSPDSRHVPCVLLLQRSSSWHCSPALRATERTAMQATSVRLAWVRCPAARRAAMQVKDENWGGEGVFGLISPRNGWRISVVNRDGSSGNAYARADLRWQSPQACRLGGTPDAWWR